MMKSHDVYSYGVASSSTLYSISGAFPAAEGYAEINDVRHLTGVEATNSSIVLSRLGATVKRDGNWLGADDGGRRTKALLSDYQIDTSRLPLRKGYLGSRIAESNQATSESGHVGFWPKADASLIRSLWV